MLIKVHYLILCVVRTIFSVKWRPINDINGTVLIAGKSFSIKFTKSKGKFCWHYNGDKGYVFVNGKNL